MFGNMCYKDILKSMFKYFILLSWLISKSVEISILEITTG